MAANKRKAEGQGKKKGKAKAKAKAKATETPETPVKMESPEEDAEWPEEEAWDDAGEMEWEE